MTLSFTKFAYLVNPSHISYDTFHPEQSSSYCEELVDGIDFRVTKALHQKKNMINYHNLGMKIKAKRSNTVIAKIKQS